MTSYCVIALGDSQSSHLVAYDIGTLHYMVLQTPHTLYKASLPYFMQNPGRSGVLSRARLKPNRKALYSVKHVQLFYVCNYSFALEAHGIDGNDENGPIGGPMSSLIGSPALNSSSPCHITPISSQSEVDSFRNNR